MTAFEWCCEEGPLAAENLRGIRFNLMNASISESYPDKVKGRLTKLSRNAMHAAFMSA